MEAIRQVQGRMTTDIRAEDDVINLSLENQKDVHVVLRAHTNFNDADIKAAVLKHLEAAGFRDAKISFIRPAIDPIFIRPPVTVLPPGAVIGTSMKDRVGIFASNIDQVHKRMTEEIRIEDAVVSVKLKGAKVEITIQDGMATSVDSVKSWAKEELKKRGVTLPITFKIKDER